jgi:hypothetical protein
LEWGNRSVLTISVRNCDGTIQVLARDPAREQRIRFEKIQASTARDNEVMRKRVLGSDPLLNDPLDGGEWLKLQELAEVEVTSEADGYPVESAFNFGAGPGWRAASPGWRRGAELLKLQDQAALTLQS